MIHCDDTAAATAESPSWISKHGQQIGRIIIISLHGFFSHSFETISKASVYPLIRRLGLQTDFVSSMRAIESKIGL